MANDLIDTCYKKLRTGSLIETVCTMSNTDVGNGLQVKQYYYMQVKNSKLKCLKKGRK